MVPDSQLRSPVLDKFYQHFLNEERSADFIEQVSRRYSLATLERLADEGGRVTRRAAVLALGFLGDFDNNEIMGRALSDEDRAVRMLADHGIRQLWHRQGNPAEQSQLARIARLTEQDQMREAVDEASCLLDRNHDLGEAWSYRAVAYCALGDYESALVDCRETLQCNRFHFPAAIGLAHCCMKLDEVSGALAGFRLAVNINPELDGIRSKIRKLERLLES